MDPGSLYSVISYLAPITVSALTTRILLKWWISTGSKLGFTGRDMNKPGDVRVVEAGGIWVILGAVFGILTYVAVETYTEDYNGFYTYFAISQVLLLAGLLGLMDDMLGWKKGLRKITRVMLTIPISLPIVVIREGHSTMEIPLMGAVDLGVLYPLLVVPLGVMGASNAFNMIAGYNGLEGLQALLITLLTLVFAIKKGITVVVPLLLVMAASILFFLYYNWYPAKVFPGNTFTYGFGAFYASLVIYGNFEKFGLAMFTLYFIELALFLRGLRDHVYKENFGIPRPSGCLDPPYSRVYSLTHLALIVVKKVKGCAREVDVVFFIALLQLAVGLLALTLL
ncbi:MAG: glycosyl transferase family 4 [Desulfurococcus sp.]|nr:glycosyl transferase family 4 [Desulfurococcus sp.]